ncbi:hypothetical protein BU16DRAFT_523467 [Lophium mytilinum]|uniref:Uncharacterized protein n=1 Tax=Lophium mytilinum TaxID=390894 RepID=A0A6A6R7F9_9PEZI|nr:hypothetical protein BU16DRAFT_523467 [Lophium mytilinum]
MPSELIFFSCGHHRLTTDDTEQIENGMICQHTVSKLPCESCSGKDPSDKRDFVDPYLVSLPHLNAIFIAHGYELSCRYAAATATAKTPKHEEARQLMADAVQSFADLTEQYLSGRFPKPPLKMMMSVICSSLDTLDTFATVVAGLEQPQKPQERAGSPSSKQEQKSRSASVASTSTEGSASMVMSPASSVSATSPRRKTDPDVNTKPSVEEPDFIVYNGVKYPRASEPFGCCPVSFAAELKSPDPDGPWVPAVFERTTIPKPSTPLEKDGDDSDPDSIQQHIDLVTSVHELVDSSTAEDGRAGLKKEETDLFMRIKLLAAAPRNLWACHVCEAECFSVASPLLQCSLTVC